MVITIHASYRYSWWVKSGPLSKEGAYYQDLTPNAIISWEWGRQSWKGWVKAGALPPAHNTRYKELPAVFAEVLAQLPEPKARGTIRRPSCPRQSRCCSPGPLAWLHAEAQVPADAVCSPPHPELLAGAHQEAARRGHQHPGSLARAPRKAAVRSLQKQSHLLAGSLQRIFSTTKVTSLVKMRTFSRDAHWGGRWLI